MKLSQKARSLVMRAYTSNRPISTFDEATETDLIKSGLFRYSTKPLMVLTHDGKKWAANRQRIAEHG